MAIPRGAGTEVLNRVTTTGDHATAQVALTVTALHIYTILSITICEQGSNDENCTISMTDAANSNREIMICQSQTLNAFETFVWNDKFVLHPADTLKIKTGSASDIDCLVTYIDQDWS